MSFGQATVENLYRRIISARWLKFGLSHIMGQIQYGERMLSRKCREILLVRLYFKQCLKHLSDFEVIFDESLVNSRL